MKLKVVHKHEFVRASEETMECVHCGFEDTGMGIPPLYACTGPKKPRKNCHSCKHLDFDGGDNGNGGDEYGFICTKKELSESAEQRMLERMEDEEYLERGKRCHEPKTERTP